jgi:hypothetical protein
MRCRRRTGTRCVVSATSWALRPRSEANDKIVCPPTGDTTLLPILSLHPRDANSEQSVVFFNLANTTNFNIDICFRVLVFQHKFLFFPFSISKVFFLNIGDLFLFFFKSSTKSTTSSSSFSERDSFNQRL